MNQKEVEEHFQDFVRYLATKLSTASNVEGRIVVVPTQSRLANLLIERKADFYMESPYPTYLINSVYGAGKLFLRRWKGGMADYHTLIFTKRNGQTKRLEDLQGKTIAFEDPESTSGHFLPKMFLSRKGFKLVRKTQIAANVSRGEVGYIFANSQDKLVDLVLTQQVAAGAFSNDDYAALDGKKKSDVAILAETASLPRHLVSVRRNLPPAFIQLAITSRKFVVDRLGHAKEICFAGAGKFQRRTVLKIFFWRRVPTTMADALISRASVIAIAVSSITKVVVA